MRPAVKQIMLQDVCKALRIITRYAALGGVVIALWHWFVVDPRLILALYVAVVMIKAYFNTWLSSAEARAEDQEVE